MALNKTYLNAGRNSASDECMTPYYAVGVSLLRELLW